IAGALVYPAMVLAVAFLGLILVAAVVAPKAREIFSQLGSEAPRRIESAVSAANLTLVTFLLLVGGVIAAAVAVRALRRGDGPRATRVDRLLLSVPGFGSYLSAREMVNLTFALETLTESGVPVEEALAEAAHAVGNRSCREAVQACAVEVTRGVPLSQALLSRSAFPDRIGRWVIIGERTGQVEKVFRQLRIFYQAELENRTQVVLNLVEPALIIVVGAVLLAIILTVVVPLFSLVGSIMPG
ncbi:MAG TPA: type II secretion system F family protein, partial [Spirochaetia bacterium]|nr:type II secretion system F family protein [Spirochaetia bacterium]